jgi:hypothetical protein
MITTRDRQLMTLRLIASTLARHDGTPEELAAHYARTDAKDLTWFNGHDQALLTRWIYAERE